ncbi:MAG: hypothetical protein J6X55_01275 [Victivallales bacterium]|nr:hypothetical protein [Victivallales bacterium]
MNDCILDNGIIRVAVPEDASRLTVSSKKTGFGYTASDYVSFTYGNFYVFDLVKHAVGSAVMSGDSIHITFERMDYWARFPENGFKKPKNGPDLRFCFSIRLQDDEVAFSIDEITGLDDETLSVSFPNRPLRWNQADHATLVVGSRGCGALVPFPGQPSFRTTNRTEILPLYGIYGNDGGMAVRYGDRFDQWTTVSITQDACFIDTAYDFIRGIAEYRRTLYMSFLAAGEGYVTIAKNYRRHVEKEGRLFKLKDKIADNPEVGKLPGSVIWKHNVYWTQKPPAGVEHDYSLYVLDKAAGDDDGKPNNWTAREVFDTAHAAGFDRVCILNTGWNRYGFDSGYPTRFPVNPERGTADDFKNCADYGRSLSEDYILSVHDNYRDCYRNSPEFNFDEMIQTVDGAPLRGGIWHGGRCYLMCTKNGVKYAKRDLPRIAELTGRGCIYIDVLGCTTFQPCFHPNHPGSARDDAFGRMEILREAKRCFGAVATECNPADYCLDCVDLGAYVQLTTWRTALHSISIPLWQLIYHDCVLNFAAVGHSGMMGAEFRATQALYTLLPTKFDNHNLRISNELRNTCLEEMVSHEFLDGNCQRTVFSDGMVITANLVTGEWKAMRQ